MGYQLLDGIMQTVTEDQDMPTVIYSLSYLYSIIGTWIVSTGVNTDDYVLVNEIFVTAVSKKNSGITLQKDCIYITIGDI